MTRRTLHPMLQKIAALVVLGVALGAAISSVAYPVVDALGAREAALVRLGRYQEMIKAPAVSGAAYDPSDLSAAHVDHADAQLALQAIVDKLARAAGLSLQSIQPLPPEHLGEIGRGAWLELTFTTDLQALTDFIGSFDAERPVVLVRRLEIERGDTPRPDLFLRVKMEIGRTWRPSGGGA